MNLTVLYDSILGFILFNPVAISVYEKHRELYDKMRGGEKIKMQLLKIENIYSK